MTKVTWRDYQPGDEYHLKCWRVPKIGAMDWQILTSNLLRRRRDTYTFIDERGEVLGMAGIVYHNKSNAEGWNYLNDDALRLPALPLAVRRFTHWLQEDRGIIRLWATGDPEEGELPFRYLAFLGMEYEGTVSAWRGGKDMHFFARIRR